MDFEKAAHFIWTHGRLLERRVFEYIFHGGSMSNVMTSLTAYQNEDGGFGNAIEPDLRVPGSQPLFMEFALRFLYDCNIKDEELSQKACDYISKHADLKKGIQQYFLHQQTIQEQNIGVTLFLQSHHLADLLVLSGFLSGKG